MSLDGRKNKPVHYGTYLTKIEMERSDVNDESG